MLTMSSSKKLKGSFIIVGIIIIALLSSLSAQLVSANNEPPLKPVNAAAVKQSLNIVVLGDSLAAGYEHGFDEKSVPYGFAEHIYEQALFNGYRATFQNYGVLGLKSSGLKKWLEAAEKQAFISSTTVQAGLKDPRVDTIIGDTAPLYNSIKNADLIVLAIGGNDFLSVLSNINLSGNSTALTKDEKDALLNGLDEVIANYEAELTAILQSITALNPNATIATQNHYLPLPTSIIFGDTPSYVGLSSELVDFAKQLEVKQAKLNTTFSNVLKVFQDKGTNAVIVDASSIISPTTVKLTNILQGDVHPNSNGYLALGKSYGEALFGQFKAVAPRADTTPISVVVNGSEVISPFPTILKNGRTYLVLRDISDAMGAELTWDNKTQTATMNIDGHSVSITIGANHLIVDGKQQALQADPAFLEDVNGEKKTYVPIAALSEGFGFHVVYRHQQKIAFINE